MQANNKNWAMVRHTSSRIIQQRSRAPTAQGKSLRTSMQGEAEVLEHDASWWHDVHAGGQLSVQGCSKCGAMV